jgi:hypothetical protein
MDRIQAAGGSRIFVQLDAIKQALGEHSELMRDIWKDPDMRRQKNGNLSTSFISTRFRSRKAHGTT